MFFQIILQTRQYILTWVCRRFSHKEITILEKNKIEIRICILMSKVQVKWNFLSKVLAFFNKFSASSLLIGPWNHSSFMSWSFIELTSGKLPTGALVANGPENVINGIKNCVISTKCSISLMSFWYLSAPIQLGINILNIIWYNLSKIFDCYSFWSTRLQIF